MKSSLFNNDEIYGLVEHQAAMGPRRPGSPAGHENEDFVESKLRDFGLSRVRKEPIDITYWDATEYHLEVGNSLARVPMECFPIPYTRFTPEGGREAPLVYADPTKLVHRGDWYGKIVVTEVGFPGLDPKLLLKLGMGSYDPHDTIKHLSHPATWVRLGWHLYHKAARRGACGFIGIIRDQPGGSCRMFAPYGFKEKDILNKPIPGLWIRKQDGARVVDLAKSGQGSAKMQVRGVSRPSVMHNIVAEVEGKTDEVLFLSCHHDSPFESPVEDGSGVAVVLALARHFAERKSLNRKLVIALTAGHFYGSLGTRTLIAEHKADVVAKTVAAICVEHIALEAEENSDGHLVPTGMPEPSGLFVPFNRLVADAVLQSMKDNDVSRCLLLPAEGPLGDYPPTDGGDWYEAGVPVVNMISNPVYLLTDDDALEWVDKERLGKVAGAFVDIITKLDAMPKEAIAQVDSKAHLLKMKAIKHIARNRTSFFGLKPVY